MIKLPTWIREHNLLLLIVLVGAVLRFYKLDFQSPWLDEIFTLKNTMSSKSMTEIYDALKTDVHPPLYYYTIHLFNIMFGDTSYVARIVSVLFGIAGIFSVYYLAKELFNNKRISLTAAVLLSVNYFHIFFSQEARMYSMLFFTATVSFYYLIRYIKEPTMKNVALYGVASGLMISSHFFGLFVLFSQYVILLTFLFLAEDKISFFLRSAFSGVVAFFVFIPSIKILLGVSEIKQFWIPEPTLDVYTNYFKYFFGHSELVLAMVGFLFIIYFIGLSREKDTPITYNAIIENKSVFSFVILSIWIVITILIPLIRSYLSIPMLQGRYFAAVLPAIIIVLAVAISRFNNYIIQIGLISIFIVFSVTDLFVVKKYYSKPHKDQFREVSQFLINNNKNNEPIATSWSSAFSYFLKNDHVNMNIVDKNLESYINEMMQNPLMIKSFWYTDAHESRPYNVSESAQKFLDENFVEENNINLYDAWAKHFVPITLNPVNISKYNPLSDKNGDSIKFWVENFEANPNEIIIGGWAFLKDIAATQSKIEIVLINSGKAVKTATKKISREDITPAFNSNVDLSNSGFSSKIKMTNIEKGNYRVGIMIKNKEFGKEGIVLTDKTFSKL